MWLLDGYNCIKRSALWEHDSLEKARLQLIAWCNDRCRHRIKDREILIVFDGQGGMGPFQQKEGCVRVVFACGMSADAYIKRYVESNQRPSRIRVVTDDKAVGYYVRALGAVWVPVKEFFDKTAWSDKTSPSFLKQTEKNLTPDQIALINEELRRRWGKRPQESE